MNYLPIVRDVASQFGEAARTFGAILYLYNDKYPEFFSSQTKIAECAGLSRCTVNRHISVLVDAGILENRGRRARRTNSYKLSKSKVEILESGHFRFPLDARSIKGWAQCLVLSAVVHRCGNQATGVLADAEHGRGRAFLSQTTALHHDKIDHAMRSLRAANLFQYDAKTYRVVIPPHFVLAYDGAPVPHKGSAYSTEATSDGERLCDSEGAHMQQVGSAYATDGERICDSHIEKHVDYKHKEKSKTNQPLGDGFSFSLGEGSRKRHTSPGKSDAWLSVEQNLKMTSDQFICWFIQDVPVFQKLHEIHWDESARASLSELVISVILGAKSGSKLLQTFTQDSCGNFWTGINKFKPLFDQVNSISGEISNPDDYFCGILKNTKDPGDDAVSAFSEMRRFRPAAKQITARLIDRVRTNFETHVSPRLCSYCGQMNRLSRDGNGFQEKRICTACSNNMSLEYRERIEMDFADAVDAAGRYLGLQPATSQKHMEIDSRIQSGELHLNSIVIERARIAHEEQQIPEWQCSHW